MIASLTQKQVARMPEWVDKWVKIGLSCEPADFETAEAAMRACYDSIKAPQPQIVLRTGSPYACIVLGVRYEAAIDKINAIPDHLPAETKAKTIQNILDQTPVSREASSQYRPCQFWAGWHAKITYFRDVVGIDVPALKDYAHEEALAKSCGFSWWGNHVGALSARPKHIHLDDRGRLHSATEKAIEYPDGWGLYVVHGVVVPDDVIPHPESITVERIQSERNAEVRRVLLDLYGGFAKFAQNGKIKSVAKDSYGEILQLGEDFWIKVKNSTAEPDGSFKDYYLNVNPDHYNGYAGKVPQAALASTWRKGPKGSDTLANSQNDLSTELAFPDWHDYVLGFES